MSPISSCAFISQCRDVWFATNAEVRDYVTAVRNLRFSADCSMVCNPSATTVTVGVNGAPVTIPSGTTVL